MAVVCLPDRDVDSVGRAECFGLCSHSTGFGSGVPAYVWWFTEAKVLLLYLRLAVWPWPLVIHYEYDYLDSLAAAWPWVVPAAIFALVAAILFWRRTAIGFALVSMLAILSPTLVVPVVTEVAAERRMYLPWRAGHDCGGGFISPARATGSFARSRQRRCRTVRLAAGGYASGLRRYHDGGVGGCRPAGDGLQRSFGSVARCPAH